VDPRPDCFTTPLRRIYVPNSSHLWLHVLPVLHDHPLQVIFGQTKDPSLSPYAILLVQTSQSTFRTTAIMHHPAPVPNHAPQTLWTSQQLLISEKLEFHIHGFHREAPTSPVIPHPSHCDCLSKHHSSSQFTIPYITSTCTTFILHIFSKHQFQATSLPIMVQNLYPTSSGPSELQLDMKLHFTSGYHLKVMEKPNKLIDFGMVPPSLLQPPTRQLVRILPVAEFAYTYSVPHQKYTLLCHQGLSSNLTVHMVSCIQFSTRIMFNFQLHTYPLFKHWLLSVHGFHLHSMIISEQPHNLAFNHHVPTRCP